MTKFLVDRMLGQTAKWLRLMGIDTKYAPEGDDVKLLEIAEKEDRIIVTRDKELAERKGVILVKKEPPEKTIPFILKRYEGEIEPMSRCSKCNGIISNINREKIKDDVPEKIYNLHEKFWVCETCNQIYWKGSHWDSILEKIEDIKNKME